MTFKRRFIFFMFRNHVTLPIPSIIEPFPAIGTFVRFHSGMRSVMCQNALVTRGGKVAYCTFVHAKSGSVWQRFDVFKIAGTDFLPVGRVQTQLHFVHNLRHVFILPPMNIVARTRQLLDDIGHFHVLPLDMHSINVTLHRIISDESLWAISTFEGHFAALVKGDNVPLSVALTNEPTHTVRAFVRSFPNMRSVVNGETPGFPAAVRTLVTFINPHGMSVFVFFVRAKFGSGKRRRVRFGPREVLGLIELFIILIKN